VLETIGLGDWTPKMASVLFGILIGTAFGVLAQGSKFCLRRSLVGDPAERASAAGVWAAAFGVAIAGTAALVAAGVLDFSENRFHATSVAGLAVLLGGGLFGAGMVLARGCASRLTVLAGSGNLRAISVLLVFAITAHATLKGALAPARIWLASLTIDFPGAASLSSLPGGLLIGTGVLVAAALIIIARSGVTPAQLTMGLLIGALIPLAWLVTSVVLADEFDPITQESLAFTSSASETLFWWVAGTAVAPGFGVGVLGGTLLGSLLAALASGEFAVSGFTAEKSTGSYLLGGALMGVGGVLAGGCTVGAGLSGISTLSISALLALTSITAGALLTHSLLSGMRDGAEMTPTPSGEVVFDR
jgi:uncharacterized membrane protein YedE/YeeE